MRRLASLFAAAAVVAVAAVAPVAGDEYGCDSYPGTTFTRGQSGNCFCACDGSRASECLRCPDGFQRKYDDKGLPSSEPKCVKVSTQTVWQEKELPLECPTGWSEPQLNSATNELFCEEDISDNCPTPPGGVIMGHEEFAEFTSDCRRRYKLVCPPGIGKDPELDTAKLVCKYKIATQASNSVERDMISRYDGFDGPNGAGVFTKAVACPMVPDIDAPALFCGPNTAPFIRFWLTHTAEVQKEKNMLEPGQGSVPHKQCLSNCAAFYAKLQECAQYNCDARSVTGSTPIRDYVARPDGADDKKPIFATVTGNGPSIPDRLFTSREGALWNKITGHLGSLEALFAGQPASKVDFHTSVARTTKKFVDQPFAISCRAFGKNNMNADLNKGTTVEQCEAACDSKYA